MGVAFIPLDKAYLTAIWLETLFYGTCAITHDPHVDLSNSP